MFKITGYRNVENIIALRPNVLARVKTADYVFNTDDLSATSLMNKFCYPRYNYLV